MINKTNYVLLFCLIFFSCNEKKTKVDSVISEEETTHKLEIESKTDYKIQIDKSLLDGVWAENEFDNAVFEIKKDSLRYVEFYDKPYFFDLKEDSLMIFISKKNISSSKVLKITKDSLVLKSEYDEIIRLVKRN